jgi:hypothetical protein
VGRGIGRGVEPPGVAVGIAVGRGVGTGVGRGVGVGCGVGAGSTTTVGPGRSSGSWPRLFAAKVTGHEPTGRFASAAKVPSVVVPLTSASVIRSPATSAHTSVAFCPVVDAKSTEKVNVVFVLPVSGVTDPPLRVLAPRAPDGVAQDRTRIPSAKAAARAGCGRSMASRHRPACPRAVLSDRFVVCREPA